ncbi:hypothetical protein ACHAXN_011634 [Cyclotella atomus]
MWGNNSEYRLGNWPLLMQASEVMMNSTQIFSSATGVSVVVEAETVDVVVPRCRLASTVEDVSITAATMACRTLIVECGRCVRIED